MRPEHRKAIEIVSKAKLLDFQATVEAFVLFFKSPTFDSRLFRRECRVVREKKIERMFKRKSSADAKIVGTSYCNRGHRLKDGVPIDHECHVLPPAALRAECGGDVSTAIEIISDAKPLRQHRGARTLQG